MRSACTIFANAKTGTAYLRNPLQLERKMSKLFIVPTPVGNLGDFTYRAKEVLEEAGLILAEDTRTSAKLLQHYRIFTPCRAYHQFNEHKVCQSIVKELQQGVTMALITDAGTPAISDPGFLLVRACVENGIEVECLPGATAFVPALVQSGLPCERFAFEGFLPHQKGRNARIEQLKYQERTFVLYESPHRIAKTLQQLAQALGAERKACLCREISKVFAESHRGTLGELSEFYQQHEAKGEMVLVVEGASRPAYSYLYPRPALTADFILLARLPEAGLHLLLVERKQEPFARCHAFPGGFLEEEETLEWCAQRELREETGFRLKDWGLAPKAFRPYSDPGRDPRARTVTMVYYALLECDCLPQPQAGDDAAVARWFPIGQLPPLAFDHERIWREFAQEMLPDLL